MGRLHEWKGRLQNQTEGYPFDNGPPFLDHEGDASWPVRAGGGFPINGIDVAIAGFVGPEVTATFSGTSTGNMTMLIIVAYIDAVDVEQTAEVSVPVTVGETAAVIAAAVGAALDAEISDTDATVAVAGAVLTITVDDAEKQLVNGLYALVANHI